MTNDQLRVLMVVRFWRGKVFEANLDVDERVVRWFAVFCLRHEVMEIGASFQDIAELADTSVEDVSETISTLLTAKFLVSDTPGEYALAYFEPAFDVPLKKELILYA